MRCHGYNNLDWRVHEDHSLLQELNQLEDAVSRKNYRREIIFQTMDIDGTQDKSQTEI